MTETTKSAVLPEGLTLPGPSSVIEELNRTAEPTLRRFGYL